MGINHVNMMKAVEEQINEYADDKESELTETQKVKYRDLRRGARDLRKYMEDWLKLIPGGDKKKRAVLFRDIANDVVMHALD